MMSRIIRTSSALQDLDSIWDYIAIENHHPADADRLIDEIDKVLHLLRVLHAARLIRPEDLQV